MEKQEQRILEALLGVILIILLVIMIFLFTLPSGFISSSTEETSSGAVSTTTITDSFNTNNYYNTQQKYSPSYAKADYTETNYNYLDYNYDAYKKTVKGVLGNDVENYIVYVKNQDYKPGYFRVNYYFTDYYGNIKTETITYYIKAKESKKFIYKNIYKDKYRFYDWNYDVTSRTKI